MFRRKASKGKLNKAKKEAIGEREIFKEKISFEVFFVVVCCCMGFPFSGRILYSQPS